MKKTQLIAPAGDSDKMQVALEFGADAVYLGLPDFSLRARINRFDAKEVLKAADHCRRAKKKIFLTMNIYAHNRHLEKMPAQIRLIKKAQPDAVVIADPGLLAVVKKNIPSIPVHLSTQANTTNIEAVKFWQRQGVERIILARELSLAEIRQIKRAVPKMELEVFVHGAMCMAYSGRCLLSKMMAGREANLGDCAQPCRWGYRTAEAVEEENGKVMTVSDDQGRFSLEIEEERSASFIFNSFDICLIDQLEKLIGAGVQAFKVEGRSKSIYYLATVIRAYRQVLDAVNRKDRKKKDILLFQRRELEKLSSRGYWTGFLLGDQPPHLTEKASLETDWQFVGISREKEAGTERKVFVHNRLEKGQEVEVILPSSNQIVRVEKISDAKGGELFSAHGGKGEIFQVIFSEPIKGPFLLRARTDGRAGRFPATSKMV